MSKTLLVLLMMVTVMMVPPVAASPPAAADEKDSLTEKDILSGTFNTLEQMTGLGILGLRILYETSGAQDFEEFALALMTAYNLQLDPQFVLRGLYENSLKEILQSFGLTPERIKQAIELTKRQLKTADEDWKRRT